MTKIVHKQFNQSPDGARAFIVSVMSDHAQITVQFSDSHGQDPGHEVDLSEELAELLPDVRKALTKVLEENGI